MIRKERKKGKSEKETNLKGEKRTDAHETANNERTRKQTSGGTGNEDAQVVTEETGPDESQVAEASSRDQREAE